QEPHVKSGCGGLRDYQNLLWMTYFKEGALSTNQLVGKDWLSETDQRRIERAYDFLLRLRTDLHYATGRATDILHTNLQEEIAKRLHYSPGNGQLRSEALMRDYYEHTRNIFRVSERITAQFVSGYATNKTRSLFSFLPLIRSDKTAIGDSFFIRQKQLYPIRRDLFRRDPDQMIRSFQLAQEHGLELSPELADLLSRSLHYVTRTYQYARGPREIFKRIEDPFVLYLALLLHDTGKAVGARPHSEASALFAQRVATRLQLSSQQRKSLILLVDHHLTLSRMAQQRNLDDPATVVEF